MRSFVRHGLVLGTCLTAFIATAGCEQKKATEYVTGVTTQVQVPRDLKSVKIQVSTGGFVQFGGDYKVYNGTVLLPRSLGEFASTSDALHSGPVTFTISGLTDEFVPGSSTNPVFNDSQFATTVGQNNVRILRRSTQPYIPDHILFLPMALRYACYDKTCSPSETCKGGLCVSADLPEEEARKLPEYTPGMGEGQDGSCFNSSICMAAAIPAAPIDAVKNCDFVVPESKDAVAAFGELPKEANPFRAACTTDDQCTPRKCTNGQCDLLPPGSPSWDGVNVEIGWDGGKTKEVLDLDKDEGFFIPDPAKPQTFRLAPGLCAMLRGDQDASGVATTAHRITSVRVSGTCAPKLPTQSICYADQLAAMGADRTTGAAPDVSDASSCTTKLLAPTKSGLVLVVDNTTGHQNFFKASADEASYVPQVSTLLRDPVFRSVNVGMILAGAIPGSPAATCAVPKPLSLTQGLFPGETPDGGIAALIKDLNDPTDGTIAGKPDLKAPLSAAYDALEQLDDTYARRAVVVLTNSDASDVATCGDAKKPTDLAKEKFEQTTKPIATFAARLVKGSAATVAQLATAGSPKPLTYNFDPPSDKDKINVLSEVTNYVAASCLYEAGSTPPTPDTRLAFADPLTSKDTQVVQNANCTTGAGWTLDTSDAAHTRVRLCPDSCAAYQTAVKNGAAFALLYNQVATPVPLYASTAACFPK